MTTGFSFTPFRRCPATHNIRTPHYSSNQIRDNAPLSKRLSTFENLGHLGSGSFSDVFKVYDAQSQRIFALKRSRKAMRTEKAMRDALNEVTVMSKLNAHVGICSMTEREGDNGDDEKEEEAMANVNIVRFERHWLTTDGRLFQIFEFCEHGTLRQLIQSNAQFTPLQTLQCARQMCCGLELVHSAHVIHLDLKPENVLIARNCVLKICDFGISIDAAAEARKFEFSGDPTYIAPEVLHSLDHTRTHDINDRTDIFSLGVMVLEMHCGVELSEMKNRLSELRSGEVDFEGILNDKANSKKLKGAVARSRHKFDGADQAREREIRSLCRRMLRKVSTQRPSAVETRREIDRVVADHALERAMRGIDALNLQNNSNSKTPPMRATNTISPFATPSVSKTRSRTRTRQTQHRPQQRLFTETPLHNFADVQRSTLSTRTSQSTTQNRIRSKPKRDSRASITKVRLPHRLNDESMESLFGLSSLWNRSVSPSPPARVNRTLNFGTPSLSPAHFRTPSCSPELSFDLGAGDGAEMDSMMEQKSPERTSEQRLTGLLSNACNGDESKEIAVLRAVIERQEQAISDGDRSVEKRILWANVERLKRDIHGPSEAETHRMFLDQCAQLSTTRSTARQQTPSLWKSQSTDWLRTRGKRVMNEIMDMEMEMDSDELGEAEDDVKHE